MRHYFFLVLGLLFIGACGKDKLQTKPSITIKSISSAFIPNGSDLTIEMEFADKEGDISNTLFVQKIRLNQRVTPTIRDTFSLPIANFPKNSRGFLQVNMNYQNHLVSAINPPSVGGTPPQVEDDTLTIRFALRDLGGNVSDTVSAGTIIVSRN